MAVSALFLARVDSAFAGSSGADQYIERVPTPGGDRDTESRGGESDGSKSNGSGGSSSGSGAGTTPPQADDAAEEDLRDITQGPEGQKRKKQRGKNDDKTQSEEDLAGDDETALAADVPSGGGGDDSDGGGLSGTGVVVIALLLLGPVGLVAFLWHRRRRGSGSTALTS